MRPSRRAARRAALQALYAILVGEAAREEALEESVALHPTQAHYAATLVDSALEIRLEAFERIARHLARGWTLERTAVMDRVLLWLAQAELWGGQGVPPKVTISETLALAKQYGSAESPRFVHGVLARLVDESPKASWKPGEVPEEWFVPEEAPVEELDEEPAEDDGRIGPWTIRSEAE